MRPDGLLGPEEDLLVGAGAVLERLLDLQELAPLPLAAVEGDGELAAEPRDVGDGHALEGLEVLRRVELGLAQAEDLLPGAGPVALGARTASSGRPSCSIVMRKGNRRSWVRSTIQVAMGSGRIYSVLR